MKSTKKSGGENEVLILKGLCEKYAQEEIYKAGNRMGAKEQYCLDKGTVSLKCENSVKVTI